MGMRPDIEITIDELVLHGFHPGDKRRIARAVETELGRLMAREEAPALLQSGGRYRED